MPNHAMIRRGSKGPDVSAAQEALHARMIYTGRIDGDFGPITEKAVKDYQFQRSQADGGWMAESFPLVNDGVVAQNTWHRLDPDELRQGSRGPAVKLLQELLEDYNYDIGAIDSQFGPKTQKAVKAFQQEAGLAADGIVGRKTWAALRS
jgi:peptidoglycan hydrolase-like protein with peptidoglycan-binding domain